LFLFLFYHRVAQKYQKGTSVNDPVISYKYARYGFLIKTHHLTTSPPHHLQGRGQGAGGRGQGAGMSNNREIVD
jgi:hypothetical protein